MIKMPKYSLKKHLKSYLGAFIEAKGLDNMFF